MRQRFLKLPIQKSIKKIDDREFFVSALYRQKRLSYRAKPIFKITKINILKISKIWAKRTKNYVQKFFAPKTYQINSIWCVHSGGGVDDAR